jgi:hypothetical protein
MYIYKERENINPAVFLRVRMPKFDGNRFATARLSRWGRDATIQEAG